ncbi:MAG: energy transducer TonB [Gemmatimonadota bacterium]|nr:MAG: energy transducer TonB [Gemmatimonadota bacterium]
MKPLDLFPRIPYTRQRGRLRDPITRSESVTYSAAEIALLRTSLPNHGAVTRCPRCREPLMVGGPVVLRKRATPVWVIRCERCSIRLSISPRALASRRHMQCAGLVDSKPPVTSLASKAPQTAIAVVAHAAVVAAAVALTVPTVEQAYAPADTALLYLAPPRAVPRELPRLAPPVIHNLPDIRGFKNLVPPVTVPEQVDVADLTSQFDPRDFSGLGYEVGAFPGAMGGVIGGEGNDADYVWASEALLDEQPELISSPPLVYPAAMRNLGVEGFVVLQFVVDTLGVAERRTVEIIEASHLGFIDSARSIVCQSRYRPGRMRGLPVRVWSMVRIDFTLTK